MSDDDQILRAYATITSIRANVPERHEVEERWVKEFNVAIAKLEKSLGIDLEEFKVPQDALKRFVASCNSMTNDVTIRLDFIHYNRGHENRVRNALTRPTFYR